jgi:hypothetical protein
MPKPCLQVRVDFGDGRFKRNKLSMRLHFISQPSNYAIRRRIVIAVMRDNYGQRTTSYVYFLFVYADSFGTNGFFPAIVSALATDVDGI